MAKNKDRYEYNPFMEEYGFNISQGYIRQKVVKIEFVDDQSGETMDAILTEEEANMKDRRKFAKVFLEPESIHILREMPAMSVKLFWWLLEHLNMNQDYIIINGLQAQLDLDYKSITSIYKALEGLVDSRILAPKYGGPWIFYVNPNLFFCGDSVPFWKAHRMTKRRNYKLPESVRKSQIMPNLQYTYEASPEIHLEDINDILANTHGVISVPETIAEDKNSIWNQQPIKPVIVNEEDY